MFTDYILNGQGNGEAADRMGQAHFDAGFLRPYVNESGKVVCCVNTGQTTWNAETEQNEPVFEEISALEARNMGMPVPEVNAATSLRKDEWLMIDQAVKEVARQRLRAWSDLAASSTFGGFDGMGTMILEHETMSDSGEAMMEPRS